VIEYAALITGYRALLAVVFVLYLLAFLTRPRRAKVLPGGAPAGRGVETGSS
jgi:hypothetical protein